MVISIGQGIFKTNEAAITCATSMSLTYTWAKRGQQPVVKTSGTLRGYKVFGLIDYFTGRFFCKGHDKGRLNSESYEVFMPLSGRCTQRSSASEA